MTETATQVQPRRKKSLIGRFLSSFWAAFFIGTLVLIVLSAINWYQRGFSSMLQNLNDHYKQEVYQLAERNTLVTAFSVSFFQLLDQKVTTWLRISRTKVNKFAEKENITVFQKSKAQNAEKPSFIGLLLESFGIYLKQTTQMLWAVWVVVIFKCISVFASILLYIFAGLFGALDGLVARYIRTVEGGRESTFVFHKMTELMVQLPIWLMAIYLISPVLINPQLIVILLASSCFLLFYIATANLKKFL